jgi:hypothetical protein
MSTSSTEESNSDELPEYKNKNGSYKKFKITDKRRIANLAKVVSNESTSNSFIKEMLEKEICSKRKKDKTHAQLANQFVFRSSPLIDSNDIRSTSQKVKNSFVSLTEEKKLSTKSSRSSRNK